MEDRPQAVRGTDPAGRAQNTGGEHRRCASRPVAREPEQGSGPSLVECHSHFAWPSVIGRGALAQLFEPPYTRSVRTVVWEERRSDPSPYPDPGTCATSTRILCRHDLYAQDVAGLVAGGRDSLGW